jgi:hypothetical protein
MTKDTHSFDEWYSEVKRIVQEGRPIYLMGRPDPNEPEEFYPLSDAQVEEWDKINKHYFCKYYEDGEDPHFAIYDFVC